MANQFADKYLKCLLNDKVFNRVRKEISDSLDATMDKALLQYEQRGWTKEARLSDVVRTKIQEAVSVAVATAIDAQITAQLRGQLDAAVERYHAKTVAAVNKAMLQILDDKKIEEYVNAEVLKRLEAAALWCRKDQERQRSIDLTE